MGRQPDNGLQTTDYGLQTTDYKMKKHNAGTAAEGAGENASLCQLWRAGKREKLVNKKILLNTNETITRSSLKSIWYFIWISCHNLVQNSSQNRKEWKRNKSQKGKTFINIAAFSSSSWFDNNDNNKNGYYAYVIIFIFFNFFFFVDFLVVITAVPDTEWKSGKWKGKTEAQNLRKRDKTSRGGGGSGWWEKLGEKLDGRRLIFALVFVSAFY